MGPKETGLFVFSGTMHTYLSNIIVSSGLFGESRKEGETVGFFYRAELITLLVWRG